MLDDAIGGLKDRLRPHLIRRSFHAFGVGTARSGTHALYSAFCDAYRTSHEADSEALMELIARSAPTAEIETFLKARDRRRMLEMDSSQLNYFVLPQLLATFPHAQFVLTLRDCLSWVDSLMNHQLSGPSSRQWVRHRALRFGPPGEGHPPEERALAERGLHTLEGYLSYWNRHNDHVLRTVPGERLLVIETPRLRDEMGRVADFLGIPERSLRADRAHSNQARRQHGLLDSIDRTHVVAVARRCCGPLMDERFPGWAERFERTGRV
jgi:hypothetical protein